MSMPWHTRNNFRRVWSRLPLALLGAGILLGVTAILLLGAILSDAPQGASLNMTPRGKIAVSHQGASHTGGRSKWAVDTGQTMLQSQILVQQPSLLTSDLLVADASLLKPQLMSDSEHGSNNSQSPVNKEDGFEKVKTGGTKHTQTGKQSLKHVSVHSSAPEVSQHVTDSESAMAGQGLTDSKLRGKETKMSEYSQTQAQNGSLSNVLTSGNAPRNMRRKVFSADTAADYLDPAKSLHAAVTQFAEGQRGHYDLVFPELTLDAVSNIELAHIGELNLLYFEDAGRSNSTESVSGAPVVVKTNANHDVETASADSRDSMTLAELHMAFQPIVSQDERLLMLFVFQTFIRACQQHNLTYLLYGGSLLGAFRHHDIIPWDDDIDVLMPALQMPLVRQALRSVAGFSVYAPKGIQWKFYWRGSPALRYKPFHWPYIDIFFYVTNGTHMRDNHPDYQADFRFRLSDVFPLQLRPFARALLPVPCNMAAVLKTNYLPGICVRSQYIHKLESDTPRHLRARVSCRELFPLFSFVHRELKDDSMVETLFRGNTTLSETKLPLFCNGT